MKNVISLGAGRQSSYMLLRAIAGDFGDIPDFAIFADTGCEPSYVYDYIEWLKKEVAPFEIVTVTAGDLLQDTIEYINGKRNRVAQLPLRTMSGLLPRQCTYDYKIRQCANILDRSEILECGSE